MSGSIRFRSLREYYCNQLSGITSILPKKGINIIRYYHRCSSSEYYKQKCIYCKSTIFFHYYFKPGKTMKTFFKSKLKKGVDYSKSYNWNSTCSNRVDQTSPSRLKSFFYKSQLRIKVDPSSKNFTNLFNKNAVNSKKKYSNPKVFTTPLK